VAVWPFEVLKIRQLGLRSLNRSPAFLPNFNQPVKYAHRKPALFPF
jgi:hypothetical protein